MPRTRDRTFLLWDHRVKLPDSPINNRKRTGSVSIAFTLAALFNPLTSWGRRGVQCEDIGLPSACVWGKRTAGPTRLLETASGMTACPSEEIEGDSRGASNKTPLPLFSLFSAYLSKNTTGFYTLERSEEASEGSRCAVRQRARGCSDVVRLITSPITQ